VDHPAVAPPGVASGPSAATGQGGSAVTTTPALFGGVAWVESGVLTGWLAPTPLGYGSVLPALQGYALWARIDVGSVLDAAHSR
jgi:hypothetical protein